MPSTPLDPPAAGSPAVGLFLQARRLQARRAGDLARTEVEPEDLAARIARDFGIDASVAAAALEVLRRKGEPLGSAPRC